MRLSPSDTAERDSFAAPDVFGGKLLFAGDTRDEREAQALSRHLSRGPRRTCSATGHAWMMTMSDERALEIMSRTGFVGESTEDAI
jgi:hypothetical protein